MARTASFGHPSVEDELETLRMRLLEMGAATEELVRDAIIALTESDHTLAATIIPRDDVIDSMDLEIEAQCLRLMGRSQLLDSEVRIVSAALKIVADIERIGDHAVDISRIAQRMQKEMFYKPLADIPRLGEMARALLYESLEAFVRHDSLIAEQVIVADEEVDALYARMRRELQVTMQADPYSVLQAAHLLFVIHYIERIGDHCCSIAERVIFMETGRLRGNQLVNLDHPPMTPHLKTHSFATVAE
jgi:phosphate transport system protein